MRCLKQNEILDCVFPCPPEATCRNRGISFNCLDVLEPCRPNCVCKPGFYRNPNGECVTEVQCGMLAIYAIVSRTKTDSILPIE